MVGGIIVLFTALIVFLFAAILYVISALAIKAMADRRQIENSWLAFVPFANLYIMGLLIGKVTVGSYEINQTELVLPGIALGSALLSGLPIIGSLISLASAVAFFFALYKIYMLYAPDKAILYTVLSVFGITVPFLLFSIKDRDPQF